MPKQNNTVRVAGCTWCSGSLRKEDYEEGWPILVVDDEEVMCESMAAWLREDGYRVDTAPDGQRALELAKSTDYAICFVDLKMPGGMDGIETMMEIHRIRPDASIIIITAYATVDTAIQAMKEGAQEYIVKPCHPQEISMLVSRILKLKKLQSENAILRKKISRQYRHRDIITKNPRMEEILALTREIASMRSTVLICGDSGTGKELVARAIHYSGERAEKRFVSVSCAALTETLLESELFGHEKGAFTGAEGQTKGKFELADGGTIFLDEIGDISPKLQADLVASPPGAPFLSRGRHGRGQRGCAGDRGHQQEPGGRGPPGPVPRRSVLPAQCD